MSDAFKQWAEQYRTMTTSEWVQWVTMLVILGACLAGVMAQR